MLTPKDNLSSSSVSGHYDELDWFYRDTWGDHLHHGYWRSGRESVSEAVQRLQDELADIAEVRSGSRVCDIGCGYGSVAWSWAETRQARVTAITISKIQWAAAREKNASRDLPFVAPIFVHGDWLKNDFPSDSFDAAISIECLSHIEDKAGFFREVCRVLEPGGSLAMTAWTAREDAPAWAQRCLLEPICREGRFAGLATANEINTWIKQAGLSPENSRQIGPQVKKTWRVIFGRLLKKLMTRREYRTFLWEQLCGDRRLLLTVPRVWFAFETGMLDYVMLKARKSGP